MALFHPRESYLGVDIGNSAVKIVELENSKGRPKLFTYGYIEQPHEILTSNTQEAKEKVVAALQRIQQESHTQSKNAVAALPSYTVFTSIIHLPHMPKKELVQAVQWEAKKYVPMPLDQMILDWKILSDTEVKTEYSANAQSMSMQGKYPGIPGAGQPVTASPLPTPASADSSTATIQTKDKKFFKILLTAAPKNLVSRYVEIFQMAKLNLMSLETESFALERSLIGNDKAPVMLIDMGAIATTISIVADSVPLMNRSIDIGGQTITKAIANSLNIDMNRAEQFKRDFGLAQTGSGGEQIPKRIEFMVSSVITEIKYVLNLYQSQAAVPVEKIILSGGSAWLPHMSEYIANQLGVKVFIGDPWARVMYPMELKPVLQSIGSRLAVSVGLAMREIS